jgi:Sec-independent protein translocase protein TatA
MGFGTEIPLLLVLGFVLLGPKQMQAILRKFARGKADFEKQFRELKAQGPSKKATNQEDTRQNPSFDSQE